MTVEDRPGNPPDFLEIREITGYDEWIGHPLKTDEKSIDQVNRILSATRLGRSDPYCHLLSTLSGREIKRDFGLRHWKNVLKHKEELEQKIGRTIGIHATVIDYFDNIGNEEEFLRRTAPGASSPVRPDDEDWLDKVFSYKFMQERLQEECQRTRRYGHSLSLVLVDVDYLGRINAQYGFKTGDLVLTRIIKIIKRSIRAVDILSRFRGDQLAIILPHANKREAQELCDRIRQTVEDRSKLMKEIPEGFTITLSVVQHTSDQASPSALIQQARGLLEAGKQDKRNFVHVPS